ncbi:MAG TPA: tyrosine-type recombinase/integrase [Pseudonocardiaceae bacterium]|nr:tyrosine-type recombinase/integrase [Pseudonocardiaceae bacterium]
MTLLAPTLEGFFTERLMTQRQASPHTISGYRDTMRLLLCFATEQTGKQPSRLEISDLDVRLISAFLDHLEHERHNTASTRNIRLAAIRSLFRYAALRHPEHAEVIGRVLALPAKRFDRALISFLTNDEVKALLAAPDRTTWTGRRDHALLLTAIQTGLRVSELTGLRCQDVHLSSISYLFTQGKNRKQRTVPLTSQTVKVLTTWLKQRQGQPQDPLFPSNHRGQLSRDAVEWLIAKHTAVAAEHSPTLRTKKVTAHVLRHTTAMTLLQSEISTSVIALWLGHEQESTTRGYLHGDLRLKQRALDRTTPPATRPGRYQANDSLLTFLDSLTGLDLCRARQDPKQR